MTTRYRLRTPQPSRPLRIDYAHELNAQQLDVVQHADGHALVLAGAGSGKTRTLVYRVAWLVEHGLPPSAILLVTFTNKAALEMTNRVDQLLHGQARGLWSGTFHHTGNRILRQYADAIGYDRGYTILDQDDSVRLLKAVLGELGLDPKQTLLPKANVLRDVLSYAVNSDTPLPDVIAERHPSIPARAVERIVVIATRYAERKKAARVMDFDDLLVRWLELITSRPEIAKRISGQFQYVLVDEFQDTNRIQAAIVERLAEAHGNLLVVGDDAQSIYSFRAAQVSNILEFPKRFPQTQTFRLETNYRSTPEILAVANATIARNPEQFPKTLRPVCAPGTKPALVICRDSYQQASFVVQRVLELRSDEGRDLTDMAVLVRSSFQAIELELELNKQNVPYIVRGGLRFFEQAHVKDAVAYLKVRANVRDELSWVRLLGLQEGIGPATAARLWMRIAEAPSLDDVLRDPMTDLRGRSAAGWASAAKTLRAVLAKKDADIPGMLRVVLAEGYDRVLEVTFDNPSERREDLEQLANFAVNYESLETFLADVTLSESFRGERGHDVQSDDDVLVVSTIHQAKGLEWPVVFLVGVTDGGLPHISAMVSRQELAEERRLFYVAVTRAAQQLYLSYPIISTSFRTGTSVNHPSRFLQELDDRLVDRWELDESGDRASDDVEIDGDGDVISRIRNL